MRYAREEVDEGKKVVVIVGGGFAGLRAGRTLANREGIKVVLIDQKNHHLFQPLLYQVATAGLDPSDIAVPIRGEFAHDPNVSVHLGRVEGIDLKQRLVKAATAELHYDYLILACGAQHNYFGHPEWEDFAPGLKIVEQATEIRRRILLAFEKAENEVDSELQKEFLTFVVVGGGPTGVELAGAIADISRTVLVHDFKRIDPAQARVILVEAMPKILSSFDAKLSQHAAADLQSLGVELMLGKAVESIDANGVTVGDKLIRTNNVFWGAGVQAAQMDIAPRPDCDRAGRIKVEKDFSLKDFPEVFVVGDMASFELAEGKMLPGLAPAAMQAGSYAARAIIAAVAQQQKPEPFRYKDKGQMATIGKHRAIVQAGKLQMTGYLAWLIWLFIHVFYLVGFKNRVTVLLQWTWSYLFSKRGSRLITDREWKLFRKTSQAV